MKLKSKEPLETQIKREIINGMTFTDIEKCHSINRSKVLNLNGQITQDDVKNLKGTLADCVSSDVKEKITTLLRNGKLPKWISQQSGYPVRVINEIAKEIYGEATAPANPVIESVTPRLADKVENTSNASVSAQVKTSKVKAESETEMREMAEIFEADYKLGKTRKEIADEYGVSLSTVSRYLHKYTDLFNTETRKVIRHTTNSGARNKRQSHNGLNRQQIEEISDLIMKGFGNSEIVSMVNFKISTQIVSHIRCKNCYVEWTKDYDFPKSHVNRNTFSCSSFNNESFNKIVNMMMEGYSDREIATEMGVASVTINNIRNHKSFKKLTKDMVFPDPIDKTFYVDTECLDNISDVNPVPIAEPPVEKIIENKPEPKPAGPITLNNNTEKVTEEEFDEDVYYSNIAKAVAADIHHVAAIVVSASGNTIISSARVEKGKRIDPVPIAMMKINAKLLKGAKIYVANGRTYMSAETIAEIGAILK